MYVRVRVFVTTIAYTNAFNTMTLRFYLIISRDCSTRLEIDKPMTGETRSIERKKHLLTCLDHEFVRL